MVPETATLTERLALHYDAPSYRRVIAGKDVILHCHHYNSRLQRTIESADLIDGKKLVVTAAESVFAEHLDLALRADDTPAARWAMAELLYRHLGFGALDFSRAAEGVVTASSSHFVEGWLAGLGRPDRRVCSFAEGYIQGAFHAVTGEPVYAREVECIAQGAAACRFEVSHERQEPIARNTKRALEFRPHAGGDYVRSPNIDEQKILDALVAMPIHGGEDGLIPAFGVYLACMPADFYNRVCIGFVEEMRRVGRGTTAERLLIADAENCGMNTFRGIMSSAEWDGLIAPMLREPDDSLFAVIAISNALGWGNWHVTALEPAQALGLESLNGYEAIGVREYLGRAAGPQCFMLTGVAAGIMELIYGEGALAERFGTYHTVEQGCIGCDGPVCRFEVERVA
jgi:hypothetical protein